MSFSRMYSFCHVCDFLALAYLIEASLISILITSKNKPRHIIVRFTSYNAKSLLYKARLHLRNVSLQDLGLGKIYIKENLTEWRAELFKKVRKLRKKYNNGKAWTIDGKIFFKPELTAKPFRIESSEVLKTL